MTDRADIPDEELIATAIAGALLDVHTALPGIVTAYDAVTATCDVQPAIKRALEREDGTMAYESLPVIPNVRVCWPGSNGYEFRFPLSGPRRVGDTVIPGDTVWLMFAEADTQKWETTGQESPPGWLGRHALGSLVAYPYSRTRPPQSAGPDPSPEGRKAYANLPQMVAPEPFHVGEPADAKFLALAEKVEQQLTALKNAISSATVVAMDGGASLKTTILAALVAWPSDTACTKLKAE